MTREDALKKVKAEIQMYDEESLDSVEWEKCYEALKQEHILDKVKQAREEIKNLETQIQSYHNDDPMISQSDVFGILDKLIESEKSK